jgi:biotin-dependent carboxylase-like uncharacterized protein
MKSSMSEITVLSPGYFTTVQDLGRYGFAHLGVPVAGAMDRISLQLANHLLHNPANTAGLEMTMVGPTLQFDEETQIILCGADGSILHNGNSKRINQILPIRQGDVLEIADFKFGQYMYLAIKGGIISEIILNSRSFFPGITQTKLVHGDRLKYQKFSESSLPSHSHLKARVHNVEISILEVYIGPEISQVSERFLDQLFRRNYTISTHQNRMGIYLNELLPNQMSEILTAPVYPGTVQLTPSGKLILLMRDAQVTGGYPRILQLKEESISKLAQLKPGQSIRFKMLEEN